MRKQKSKKWLTVIIILLIAVGVGVGIFFGAKAIYNAGVENGIKTEAEEVAESVQALGQAVQDKVDFQGKISQIFGEVPETLNQENIEKYLASLDELINQIPDGDLKIAFTEYQTKWQDFKNVYDSQDNGKIAEAFNALKVNATDMATTIKTYFNEKIKTAVDKL